MEILPGVRQFKLPLPDRHLGYIFVYLLERSDGYLLIDTGWDTAASQEALTAQLAAAGVDYRDITLVMCTHFHPDHYGSAGMVKERARAKLVMHRLDPPKGMRRPHATMEAFVESMQEWLLSHGFPEEHIRQIGPPRWMQRGHLQTVETDIVAEDGDTLELKGGPVRLLWTPGHTPGHLCLYDPRRRLLFSGDHVLPKITPSIAVHGEESGNPLGDFLASLRKVQGLDVELICPGHEYTFGGLARRVDELVAHHEERCEEILKAIRIGHTTSYAIASRIHWNVGSWEQMSYWLHRAALGETLAHLEHLRRQGRVATETRDGLVRYVRM